MRLTELVPTGVVTSPASVAPIQMIAPVAIEGPIRSAESAARGGQTLRESPTGYGPPKFSDASSCAGFPGSAFAVQPDGTLLCPAQQPLYPQERRVQPNGSLRIVYAARIGHCRACPLRSQCQGSRRSSRGPRRVSAVCQPLLASSLTATESKSVQFDSSSVVMEAAPALLEPASAPIESRSMELDGSSAVMETAPALPELSSPSTSPDEPTQRGESALRGGLAQATLSVEYGPPKFSNTSSCAGFAGSAFAVQPDGTLLCPAQQPLYPQERRLLPNGSLRIVYAARIGHCRACPLRSQCQGSRRSSRGPRRVSAVCQPLLASPPAAAESRSVQVERSSAVMESVPALLEPASAAAESRSVQADSSSAVVESAPTLPEPAFAAVQAKSVPIDSSSAVVESAPTLLSPLSPAPISPVLWQDWPASQIRRRWLKLLRRETVLLTIGPVPTEEVQTDDPEQKVLTRAQRAHWRLSWSERLARNARGASAPALSITLHGLPVSFARAFALDIAA
jgi:hypothetical protein